MSLKEIREKIDGIDKRLVTLLNDRTKLAVEIGKLKDKNGGPVFAPEREMEVYRRIQELASGPLPVDSLKAIYREIMSASLALEKPIVIAYLGPEATFTHLASISKFGSSVTYKPMDTITDVFSEVEKFRADYGVIPVENSTEGAVSHSLDMFMDSDLKICSEIVTPISIHLMSNSKLSAVKRVYSKPEAFGQCRRWMETNLPNVDFIDSASTTQAAKRASLEEGSAAIASKLAATYYNLPILEEDIQDSSNNQTRFLVVSHQLAKKTRKDKTSIMFSIKDKVGALHDILLPFKKAKINLTKIESRPSKKRLWDYFFFVDLEGHVDDKAVQKAIDAVEPNVKFVKTLGSYPVAESK
jgi:chorismate mutase/prephenate dehydratase